jgi:hypothetical protein
MFGQELQNQVKNLQMKACIKAIKTEKNSRAG